MHRNRNHLRNASTLEIVSHQNFFAHVIECPSLIRFEKMSENYDYLDESMLLLLALRNLLLEVLE